ncbi:MAG: CPBP family intramembrane metalloprotease [Rhizobacter sp.]|nr:CPBP family intramembrane metalloprotease [Chlorobiales bacterium]
MNEPELQTSQAVAGHHAVPEISLSRQVMMFPLTRIILSLIMVLIPLLLVQMGVRYAVASWGKPPALEVIAAVVISLAALAGYIAFVRWVELRSAVEVSASGAAVETMAGAGIGALLMAVSIGLIALFGGYTVTGTNDWSVLIKAFVISLIAGVGEEILFRGILFRITEESLGTWIALALSAVLFGLIHIVNPNATWFSSVAIALEAGILLGAAYMLTRKLWLAIGIHFGWNFTQGGIFGVAVSGTDSMKGVLQSQMNGAEWLTGGNFGAEASVIALAVCTAAGVWMLIVAVRRGRLILPFWMRRTSPAVPQTQPELTTNN